MLFLKSTSTTVGAGVFKVDIAAKPPGRTFGIFMAVDAEHPPAELLSDIEAFGFQRTIASPYTHQDGKKVLDLHYQKKGKDIFDGWTATEKEQNLQALEALFGKCGITIAPRVMSLAEAF